MVPSAEGRQAEQRARRGRGRWPFRSVEAAPAPLLLRQATTGWEGPGGVGFTEQHLVFEVDGTHRRVSLGTILKVEWAGDVLWVQRRRAPDWLLYLADEVDAERVWQALADAIGADAVTGG